MEDIKRRDELNQKRWKEMETLRSSSALASGFTAKVERFLLNGFNNHYCLKIITSKMIILDTIVYPMQLLVYNILGVIPYRIRITIDI